MIKVDTILFVPPRDVPGHTILIDYGRFDGELCYRATVAEFPEIEEYGDSPEEVYRLSLDSLEIIFEHGMERKP